MLTRLSVVITVTATIRSADTSPTAATLAGTSAPITPKVRRAFALGWRSGNRGVLGCKRS